MIRTLRIAAMDLLEREPYLAELNAALTEARRGAGQIALISGEAGIGKTSLVNHFVRRYASGTRLFWGTCDALFTPRPLGPLYDMASQLKGELYSLLNSDGPRSLIFSTFLDELRHHPVIAVFEDVHWADEATLDLLRFLSRRVGQTLALLILTYRDDELSPRHPLRTLLGDLASSPAARRIPLTPLSAEAVRDLVGGQAIDAAALHSETGGNPFFITEVLANPDSDIPHTVRDAVLARVARLSASGLAVLEAAAVIGLQVEPWLLSAVTGAEASAVEESIASGILLSDKNTLAFRHELGWEAILDSISPPRKQVLHHLVLDALRASPGARPDLTRLTHHAEAASDREAVLAYAPAAAREAADTSAHRAAAALYKLALRFAESLPGSEHAALLENYAAECFLVDQHQDGIAAREKAIELWSEEDNLLKQGENLAHLTSLWIASGQSAAAEEASTAAIELLEQLPPSLALAQAYRVRATLHLVNRDCEVAIRWAKKALELAERFGDANVESTIHNVIGTAWLFVDYPRGCEYLERRLRDEQVIKLEARVGTTFANLGSGSGEVFQFDRAERYLADGIAYAYERDLEYTRLYMETWVALIRLYQGHWEEAGRIARDVLQRPDLARISRIVSLVALGRLQARQGDADAPLTLAEALETVRLAGTLQRLAPVHAARAEAAYLAGERDRMLVEALAVYDLALSKQHPWFAGELAYWCWRGDEQVEILEWMAAPYVLEMRGDWQAAAAAWEALGCPYEQARALAEGDGDAQLFALEIFEGLGAQPAADRLRQKLQAAGVASIPRGPRAATRVNPFKLTNRQLEILLLLTENLTNVEIADRLVISPKTVGHHVSAVLARLDVASREEAAEIARMNPDLFNLK